VLPHADSRPRTTYEYRWCIGETRPFATGTQSVWEGLDALVIGMTAGESRMERISPESAFGPYRPELVCQVSRTWMEAQRIKPLVGLSLTVQGKGGMFVQVLVTSVDIDHVTLDTNHRMAGKPLMVQLELLDILGHTGSGLPGALISMD
jgi:peptidylprolyl isomerase